MEYSLFEPAKSCDGEPFPDREAAAILADEVRLLGRPKGDLMAPPDEGSLGEELAVGDVERAWPLAACGGYPMVKCSDLVVDIINYLVRPSSETVTVGAEPVQAYPDFRRRRGAATCVRGQRLLTDDGEALPLQCRFRFRFRRVSLPARCSFSATSATLNAKGCDRVSGMAR